MEEFLLLFLAGMSSGVVALGSFFKWQGDADIKLLTDQITNVVLLEKKGHYELLFELPLVNTGKQNGMLIDILAQPTYLGSFGAKALMTPRFRLKTDNPRADWYWEAVIIKKRTTHAVEGSVIINYFGTMKELLAELPKLTLVLHLKTVGRKPINYKILELTFDLSTVAKGGDES